MKKVAVIPTYNECETVETITRAVLDVDSENEVLIVDDNSPDRTGDIADRLAANDPRVHVLHRAGKQGIGPAYKDGFRRALELGADLIVQMDADLSHSPDELPRFYELAADYDLILGSRYVDGITVVNWPMFRLMISYFGNVYVHAVLRGLPVKDATGGFKCWRREVLEAIGVHNVRSNGYAFQVEMTYRAWCLGYRMIELPIIFVDRREGTSKMSKKIAVEALFVVWWLRIQRFLGRLGSRPALKTTSSSAS
jgi:dolichol-phosphate mannosyltransferase